MIGTVRKHSTWLWALIICIIIISFVFFFSPAARLDIGSDDFSGGSIQGKPITREQFLNAQEEVVLAFFLRYRDWPSEEVMRSLGFDMAQETYTRLLIIEKLKELNVQVTPEASAQMIAEIFGVGNRAFPMEAYRTFLNEISRQGLTAEDFERFIRHEVGQMHLVSLYGVSGKLVTPQEAEYLYRRQNETIQMDAIFFDASNYVSQVSVNETNLSQFFIQNMAAYRIPDRVQVRYVKFDLADFSAEASGEVAKLTNLTAIVEQVYTRKGGTNAYVGESGKGLTLDEATPKIIKEIEEDRARALARKKAADFVSELFAYAEGQPQDKAALEKMAERHNLKVAETAPFDLQSGPSELKVPANFSRIAFRLSEEEPYYSSAVEGENAIFIIGLKNRVPSETPPLARVRDRVAEDYKLNEARRLARMAGDLSQSQLANKIAAGKSFEAAAAELKLKWEPLPTFTASTRSLPEVANRISLDRLQNVAARLATGKTSDFMATEDGGVIIHLRSRTPVSEEKLKEDLAGFVRNIRDQRQYAAYGQWLQRLPESMKLVVRQTQPTSAPAQ